MCTSLTKNFRAVDGDMQFPELKAPKKKIMTSHKYVFTTGGWNGQGIFHLTIFKGWNKTVNSPVLALWHISKRKDQGHIRNVEPYMATIWSFVAQQKNSHWNYTENFNLNYILYIQLSPFFVLRIIYFV